VGLTMTHLNPCCLASQHSFIISSFVAVLRTIVLSIISARLRLVNFISGGFSAFCELGVIVGFVAKCFIGV